MTGVHHRIEGSEQRADRRLSVQSRQPQARRASGQERPSSHELSQAFLFLPSPRLAHRALEPVSERNETRLVHHGSCSRRYSWASAEVFAGTRVPVKTLFEPLEANCTLDEFLEWFPRCTGRSPWKC